ncbi:TPA: hypothetical protein ACYLN4_006607 [Burkholderia lata]
MAMNKAERAHVEALEQSLREARALRWSDPVEPDLLASSGNEISGFYANVYSKKVGVAWSTRTYHGRDCASSKEQKASGTSASQRGIDLYSTKVRALQALRHEIVKQAVKDLAEIDRQIEEAITEKMVGTNDTRGQG